MDTLPHVDIAGLFTSTAIMDQVGDSIFITDLEGCIVYVNPAFERLTGYSRAEAIGQTPAILNSGQHPPEVFNDMWNQLSTGEGFRFIFVNRLKDGSTANHGTIISPIKDGDGKVTHYFALSRNVQESRQAYDSFLLMANSSPMGVYILRDGKFNFINDEFTRITGYQAVELIDHEWWTIVHPDDREMVRDNAIALIEGDQAVPYEYRIITKTGDVRCLLESVRPVSFFRIGSSDGRFITGNFVDITDRKNTETDLKYTLGLQTATMESTADAIHVVSRNDRALISYNQRFLEMWSIETPPEVGKHTDGLWDHMCSQVKDEESYRAVNFELIKDPSSEGTHYIEMKDGRVFEVYSKPQLIDGEPVGRVWSHRDVTKQVQFEAQLVQLANNDALTGLLNRRRLQEEMEAGLSQAEANDSKCALLLLDIDRFKEINDALGHRAGDDLLIRLADVLNQTQQGHVVARFGGDEFAVFLRDSDREQAVEAAQRITSTLRAQSSWDSGARLPVTVSIGVAVYPDNAINTDELCSHADIAMYDAKTSGRNRVSVYSPRLQQRVLRFPRDWRDRITDALEQERMELYEQPILDMTDGTMSAHELLIRLRNVDGSVIAAKHFIPFAEQSGLIQGIDQWVARNAIQLAKRLQAAGKKDTLGFNLSRWAFVDPEMLDYIRREIEESGVDTSMLLVEMTETSALADVTSAQRFMQGLRALGIRFALDDFGVGYSSFHHLKRLPVDFLKIDGSFVRDLTHNHADREIVAAMVKIAHGLDIKTIAEAVHSEAVLEITREIGVDYAQGYWIARPRPAELILEDAARSQEPELHIAGSPPDPPAPPQRRSRAA